MANEPFYMRVRGKISGPFDIAALQKLVARGSLSRIHEISSDRTTWTGAGEYEDLFPHAGVPAVAVEPAAIEQPVEDFDNVIADEPLPLTAPVSQGYTCISCGGVFPVGSVYAENGIITCKRCFAERSSAGYQRQTAPRSSGYGNQPQAPAGGTGLIVSGYVCAGVALLFCPPGFGIAAVVIGIINLTQGRIGHGVAQIVLGVGCTIIGMAFGAAMMMH